MDRKKSFAPGKPFCKYVRKDYFPIGAASITVKSMDNQILAILRRNILTGCSREEARALLAMFCTQKETSTEILCFPPRAFTQVNTIERLADLPPERQEEYLRQVRQNLCYISREASRLLQRKPAPDRDLVTVVRFLYDPRFHDADCLGPALRFPGQENIFVINGYPVITLYGYVRITQINWEQHSVLPTGDLIPGFATGNFDDGRGSEMPPPEDETGWGTWDVSQDGATWDESTGSPDWGQGFSGDTGAGSSPDQGRDGGSQGFAGTPVPGLGGDGVPFPGGPDVSGFGGSGDRQSDPPSGDDAGMDGPDTAGFSSGAGQENSGHLSGSGGSWHAGTLHGQAFSSGDPDPSSPDADGGGSDPASEKGADQAGNVPGDRKSVLEEENSQDGASGRKAWRIFLWILLFLLLLALLALFFIPRPDGRPLMTFFTEPDHESVTEHGSRDPAASGTGTADPEHAAPGQAPDQAAPGNPDGTGIVSAGAAPGGDGAGSAAGPGSDPGTDPATGRSLPGSGEDPAGTPGAPGAETLPGTSGEDPDLGPSGDPSVMTLTEPSQAGTPGGRQDPGIPDPDGGAGYPSGQDPAGGSITADPAGSAPAPDATQPGGDGSHDPGMSRDPGSGPGLVETSSNPAYPNTETVPSQEAPSGSPEFWTAEPSGDPDTGAADPAAPEGVPAGADDPVRQPDPPASDPSSASPSSGGAGSGQETGSGAGKPRSAAPGGSGDPAGTQPSGTASPSSGDPGAGGGSGSGGASGDPEASTGESGTSAGGRFALFASNEYTYTLEHVRDSLYQLRLDHKTDSSKSCRALAEDMGGGAYKISESRCSSSYMPSYMKCGSEYCTFVDGSSRETPFYIKVRRAR